MIILDVFITASESQSCQTRTACDWFCEQDCVGCFLHLQSKLCKKTPKKNPKKNPTTTCKSLTLEQSTIVYYLLPHLRNITHFLPSTMFYQATQLILQWQKKKGFWAIPPKWWSKSGVSCLSMLTGFSWSVSQNSVPC